MDYCKSNNRDHHHHSPLEDLPDPLLEHVVQFLCLTEQCRLSGLGSRRLHAFQVAWERRQRSLTIPTPSSTVLCGNGGACLLDSRILGPIHFPLHIYRHLSEHLHTLDLSSHATDAFWSVVADHGFFPHLKHVCMVGSSFLTDQGLAHLSRHVSASSSISTATSSTSAIAETTAGGTTATGGIESIDITFCRKTTYAGTFPLRDAFRHSLRVLRRQPEWMDGCFYTPFHEDSSSSSSSSREVEIHIYYPDGSFTFNRPHQSRGYVMKLESWNDDETYLADKLQYTNFEPPLGWPSWTRYSYRPGVCLLKLDDAQRSGSNDNDAASSQRTVLVGQRLGGMRPPRILEMMQENASTIRVGESCYFNAQSGERLAERPRPGDDANRSVMISKMRVEPLPTLLPPEDIVRECQRACEAIQQVGVEIVDQCEELVNLTLG